ncbi:nitroreductase/quinone reductase family protein [Pedococcus sp.]|jgi:deazaflavin-dependent oxidoreductase (nitroreductase family)|uniref:nitroreductase/quinone reductase family protein n=1 Tax=Pedococcus sp. TaxID=2860345 RepID=UPI002E167DC5|nr:nitroreductase/quinone reductase family protein [Pedococcus sp.]
MNPLMKTAMKAGSGLMVSLYQASGGRIGGRVKGLQVILLTVPGRRTGRPHTAAVSCFEHAGGYVVAGSAGGMPQDPQWFKNLRKAPAAEVQLGRRRFRVGVRELLGTERDEVWRDVVVARAPFFADYSTKGHRTIPLALLTPLAGPVLGA